MRLEKFSRRFNGLATTTLLILASITTKKDTQFTL